MSYSREPIIRAGDSPEASLQASLISEARAILDNSRLDYLLIESFGVDIAFFIRVNDQTIVKFIEVKAFVGSRQGGVGIGNNQGKGSQIDLLINPIQDLEITNQVIAWVLGFGQIHLSKPRYAFFSTIKAKDAAMGGINRGKQNNLRVNNFRADLISWDDLSSEIEIFLLA